MSEPTPATEAKPFLMLPEPITDPHALIVEFFSQFHLEDAQEFFWSICKGALVSLEFESAHSRSNLFFFAELMMQFFAATQQLFAPYATKNAQANEMVSKALQNDTIKPLHEDSQERVRAIFTSFTLEELERDLETWLKVALSSDNAQYHEGKERGSLIALHNQLRDLLRSLHKHAERMEESNG